MTSATIKVKSPARILNKAGKERRSAGKTLLLAICYGMSPATAGARMGKTREEGQELMNSFFKGFPKVKELIDNSQQFARDRGFVCDWAGRRRHLPDISLPSYEVKLLNATDAAQANFNPFLNCTDRQVVDPKIIFWENKLDEAIKKSNSWRMQKALTEKTEFKPSNELGKKAFKKLETEARADGVLITANTAKKAKAERQCLNSRIQGGAASLTKLAMINIFNDEALREYQAKLILSVHDEVLVECPAFYADKVEKRLPQIMIDTAKPYINVGMKCDPYNVTRWYSDEYAVLVQEEFKQFKNGDPKNGVPALTREAAIEAVVKNHDELPREAIINTIETGCDLDF